MQSTELLQPNKGKNDVKFVQSRMLGVEELEQAKGDYLVSTYPAPYTKFRKIPKLHITALRVLKCMAMQGLTLKGAINHLQLVFLSPVEQSFVNIVLRYGKLITYLLNKVPMLIDNPFMSFHTMRLLVGILLWGTQNIPLGTREGTMMFYYEQDFKEEYVEAARVLRGTCETPASKLPIYVRVNTLSISLEQCINAFCKEGWKLVSYPNNYGDYLVTISQLKEREFVRDIHISELLVFPPGTLFYDHPGYLKGKFILQDKGSCLASFLLNPKPGSIVLDLCAAPGKTTNHLANIINNEGTIYAVENHPHRYNKLYSFLQSTNVACAETIWGDNAKLKIDDLNYVLVDASSTYTGIFYERQKDGIRRLLKKYFHSSTRTLTRALQTFTTAKRIVYCSCTSHPEEGEKVVQLAMDRTAGSYRLLDVKELLWNEWYSVGQTVTDCGNCPVADKCLRTNPEVDKCFGYFIAVFERNFDVLVPPYRWTKPPGQKYFQQDNQDETDDNNSHQDGTSNDNNSHIPQPAATSQVKKVLGKKAKKRLAKKKKSHKPNPFENPIVSKLLKTATTLVTQSQNDCSSSQPVLEVEHDQLYP